MPTRLSGFPPRQARSLVLVRHGRTAWNLAKRAQGHTDIALDECGLAQARALAPVIAAMHPVAIWTSDLARAAQTAAAIGELSSVAVQADPRLREYSVGERSGLTRGEFQARFPREYAAWLAQDESLLVRGAESTQQVLDRMVPALREFLGALGPGELGVVVTHGACLRAALLELVGLPQSADAAFATMTNCSWTVVQEADFGGPLRISSYHERVSELSEHRGGAGSEHLDGARSGPEPAPAPAEWTGRDALAERPAARRA